MQMKHTKNVEVDRIDADRIAHAVHCLAAQVASVVHWTRCIADARRQCPLLVAGAGGLQACGYRELEY